MYLMEKIVAANLKMNKTFPEIQEYIRDINDLSNENIVIIPTSIYVPYFLNKNYSVGVQDIEYNEFGEYTGSLSPKQVSSMGVKYTIVGHSERRKHYNETDDIINKKVEAGLNNNLKVILCVGETKEQRENNQTKDVIEKEILNDLKSISNLENVIIAYEPIWAIGTGLIPKADEIKEVSLLIKDVIKNINGSNIPVLYGGSVNDTNIKDIIRIEEIDGVLVGSASLNPSKLKVIINEVLK